MAFTINKTMFEAQNRSVVSRLLTAKKIRDDAIYDMFRRMSKCCEHNAGRYAEKDLPRVCSHPTGKNSGVCAIEICPLLG